MSPPGEKNVAREAAIGRKLRGLYFRASGGAPANWRRFPESQRPRAKGAAGVTPRQRGRDDFAARGEPAAANRLAVGDRDTGRQGHEVEQRNEEAPDRIGASATRLLHRSIRDRSIRDLNRTTNPTSDEKGEPIEGLAETEESPEESSAEDAQGAPSRETSRERRAGSREPLLVGDRGSAKPSLAGVSATGDSSSRYPVARHRSQDTGRTTPVAQTPVARAPVARHRSHRHRSDSGRRCREGGPAGASRGAGSPSRAVPSLSDAELSSSEKTVIGRERDQRDGEVSARRVSPGPRSAAPGMFRNPAIRVVPRRRRQGESPGWS